MGTTITQSTELKNFLSQMFQQPDTCRHVSGDYKLYDDSFSQLRHLITYASFIFNMTIFGATSKFDIRVTFFFDDVVIILSSFSPIFFWYFITKLIVLYNVDNDKVYIALIISFFIVILATIVFI